MNVTILKLAYRVKSALQIHDKRENERILCSRGRN